MALRKGTIKGFHSTWSSGLATLEIEDAETGQVEKIPCDSGPTGRALDAYFGCVVHGHSINTSKFIGAEIYWHMDDMGLVLGGFIPTSEASEGVEEAYAKG